MKNLFKVFGIIALAAIMGFSFAACSTDGGGDDGGEGGKTLTITGLEAYEGKYIGVTAHGLTHQDGETMSIGSLDLQKVAGGKVTLTMVIVIKGGMAQGDPPPYQGTDNNVSFWVSYYTTPEITDNTDLNDITANFSAGNATVAYPAE